MSKTKLTATACSVSAIIGIVLSYGSSSGIRTNQAGLELIGNAESCRRDPYYCPAKVLTAGIGSTTGIQRNHNYSDQEIADMWITDLRIAEKCVNQYANGAKMNDNQFSAITSFAFNAGCGNLKSSTLARYAMREQWADMCSQLMRWVYIGKDKSKGLENRRGKEYALCMKPVSEVK